MSSIPQKENNKNLNRKYFLLFIPHFFWEAEYICLNNQHRNYEKYKRFHSTQSHSSVRLFIKFTWTSNTWFSYIFWIQHDKMKWPLVHFNPEVSFIERQYIYLIVITISHTSKVKVNFLSDISQILFSIRVGSHEMFLLSLWISRSRKIN